MDTVFIEALEVEALIGIYDWERRIRQPLLFDIEMTFDNRVPAASDDIADTLNYKAVSKRVVEYVSQSGFGLVEMGVFLALLVIGFVYVWKRGALEWE